MRPEANTAGVRVFWHDLSTKRDREHSMRYLFTLKLSIAGLCKKSCAPHDAGLQFTAPLQFVLTVQICYLACPVALPASIKIKVATITLT